MNTSQTDCGFPIIKYSAEQTPYEWGLEHGKRYKKAIQELVEIRKGLMLAKNPKLESKLDELAEAQANATKGHLPLLWHELEGIKDGAEVSLTDIVILNNYTDFRDIQLPEEGCTTAFLKRGHKAHVGQTWDMHSSAKDYLCVLDIERTEHNPAMLVLSLVGCTGLMAINEHGVFLGVNNINTHNAKAALIWPTLVRGTANHGGRIEAHQFLQNAPVTSGHNYILSDENFGGHYEVSPELFEPVAELDRDGLIFHTNHCLGEKHKEREDLSAKNSTSQIRYDMVEKKKDKIQSADDLIALFRDHTNYPKSICSHYQSGAQDPSMTCGSGVVDYSAKKVCLWRGCPEHDDNFVEYWFNFPTSQSTFQRS